MGLPAEFANNELLREYFEEAYARGYAIGYAEGLADSLRAAITARFGPLPAWAEAVIATADRVKLEQWLRRCATARSADTLLRSRHGSRRRAV